MSAPSEIPLDSFPRLSAGRGAGLDHLQGVVVLDLTTSVAGPYATMLLGDFGARVIKIERPERGDDARGWGPPFLDGESLWFLSVNRNKESVALDITTDAGRRVLHDLVQKVDVVVTNQPPDVQQKLGTDFATLSALNSSLVYASITGFGLSGERSGWTCYDLIAEGYSGVMDVTGAAQSDPQKIGAPAADMLAGQDAAMAIMAALVKRARSTRAQLIDISLVESMMRFLSCRIVPYMGSGEVPRRSGGTDSVIAIYQAFDTADHPITLGLGSDPIWRRFWAAVGAPEFGQNAEFASNAARRARRPEIVAEIQKILRGKTRAEWLAIMARHRIPAGPINSVADAAHDRALQDRGMIYAMEDGARIVPQVGLGIQFDGASPRAGRMPPRLGADTRAVLQEFLSLSDRDLVDACGNTID